jgi:hypothetical protein
MARPSQGNPTVSRTDARVGKLGSFTLLFEALVLMLAQQMDSTLLIRQYVRLVTRRRMLGLQVADWVVTLFPSPASLWSSV